MHVMRFLKFSRFPSSLVRYFPLSFSPPPPTTFCLKDSVASRKIMITLMGLK